MTGLAFGVHPEEAQGELRRTNLLVEHLVTEIDALGEAQERYRAQCEAQQVSSEEGAGEGQYAGIVDGCRSHRRRSGRRRRS